MSVVTKKFTYQVKTSHSHFPKLNKAMQKNRSFNLQPLVFKTVDQSLITHGTIEKKKSKLNYPCTHIKEEIKA